jgi:DNA polymerase-4
MLREPHKRLLLVWVESDWTSATSVASSEVSNTSFINPMLLDEL